MGSIFIASTSVSDTERIGELIGKHCKGGEVIELLSDVGGGKTTFVRGLVRGAGSQDAVGSPSFTLEKQYRTDTSTIHHFDFYRLADPGVVAQELAESVNDASSITIVEWADSVSGVLPKDRLCITLLPRIDSEQARDISVFCPDSKLYLLKELLHDTVT